MAERTVIGWRAWFTEGRVFDSRQHSWEELPEDGMLVAVNYFEGGSRRIEDGRDYYWLQWGEEVLANNDDPALIRLRYGDELRIIRGQYAPTVEFDRVHGEAMAAMEF